MDLLTILAAVIAVGILYRISLALWPFTVCRRCGGSGNNAGSNRKRWGNCRRCGGSGQRERLGTKLLARRRS
jgi:DnaJ-class molecular chaperone